MSGFEVLIPYIVGGAASAVVGSLLKKEQPQAREQAAAPPPEPEAPKVEAPTEMPTINDSERRAASRRSIAQQMSRRGRASTILTDQADSKLGG